jgi:hypothetical protein
MTESTTPPREQFRAGAGAPVEVEHSVVICGSNLLWCFKECPVGVAGHGKELSVSLDPGGAWSS